MKIVLKETIVAKTKIDKEKEIREKIEREASQHIAQLKASSDRTIRRKSRKIKRLSILIAILIALLIGLVAFGAYQYNRLSNENRLLSNPEESAKAETERLKEKVSKLVDVPSGEEPTIATVVDVSKLKDQSFFAKAENGDKVFMYAKAKKAILYRPSTDKIIELAPINSQSTPDKADGVQSNSSASPIQTSPSEDSSTQSDVTSTETPPQSVDSQP